MEPTLLEPPPVEEEEELVHLAEAEDILATLIDRLWESA